MRSRRIGRTPAGAGLSIRSNLPPRHAAAAAAADDLASAVALSNRFLYGRRARQPRRWEINSRAVVLSYHDNSSDNDNNTGKIA